MKTFLAVALAVALVLSGFEWYRARQAQKFIPAAHIAAGLALAANVKNHVAAFHQQQGRLPSSNAELDLPAPERFAGAALRALTVSEGGVIILAYNALSGVDQGQVRLVPDLIDPALGLAWQCITPSYPDIGAWAPQCRYQP
jgi:hypothetical protein